MTLEQEYKTLHVIYKEQFNKINRLTAINKELVGALLAISIDSDNPECTMKNIKYIVKTLVNPALSNAQKGTQ